MKSLIYALPTNMRTEDRKIHMFLNPDNTLGLITVETHHSLRPEETK